MLDAPERPRSWSAPGPTPRRAGPRSWRWPSTSRARCSPRPSAARAGFPQDHPLFAGHLSPRRARLREMLSAHDAVLAVGRRASASTPTSPGPLVEPGDAPGARHRRPGRGAPQPVAADVVADPARSAPALVERIEPRGPRPGPFAKPAPPEPPAPGAPLRAGHVLDALAAAPAARRDPRRGVAVEPAGAARPHPGPRADGVPQRAMGGLGFALPGTIGVRMALPDRPVVAVSATARRCTRSRRCGARRATASARCSSSWPTAATRSWTSSPRTPAAGAVAGLRHDRHRRDGPRPGLRGEPDRGSRGPGGATRRGAAGARPAGRPARARDRHRGLTLKPSACGPTTRVNERHEARRANPRAAPRRRPAAGPDLRSDVACHRGGRCRGARAAGDAAPAPRRGARARGLRRRLGRPLAVARPDGADHGHPAARRRDRGHDARRRARPVGHGRRTQLPASGAAVHGAVHRLFLPAPPGVAAGRALLRRLLQPRGLRPPGDRARLSGPRRPLPRGRRRPGAHRALPQASPAAGRGRAAGDGRADPLTGLFNRRSFDDALRGARPRTAPRPRSCSSTSTASRPSTTTTATRRATRSCAPSPRRAPASCATATVSRASAATSSRSSPRARPEPAWSASSRPWPRRSPRRRARRASRRCGPPSPRRPRRTTRAPRRALPAGRPAPAGP